MAHFAKLGLNSEVIEVHVVDNGNLLDSDGNEQEQIGIDYLLGVHGGGTWVQTSYNTFGGEHSYGGTPLRKNYAGIGYTYNESIDAFIPLQTYVGWILNESICQWESPIPVPDDEGPDKEYTWDENTQNWIVLTE